MSLGRSLAMNFSGQLVARVFSFGINMYLLRVVDNDVLGLVNVRLFLLYNTILFLTREPMRKANILRSSLPSFINVIWLSPLISLALSVLCTLFWRTFSSSHDLPYHVLLAFPLSAVIESLAEPFAVISLRFSLSGHFAIAQSLLISLQRVFVLVLILSTSMYHLDIFAYAQIYIFRKVYDNFCHIYTGLSSAAYLMFHYIGFLYYSRSSLPELTSFAGFRSFFPQPSHGVERESLSAIGTLFAHSIMKQLMTDGSAYVMTFTELLSLKSQAVYDAVEKVGSLVARIVLAPLEEMCFAYFSNTVNQNSKIFNKSTDTHDTLVQNFSIVLHVACVVGVVVSVFGIPYSPLAVYLYGGHLLYDNGGAVLLSLYCIYLSILAVNGITECFAMATMSNTQVFSHGGFLLLSAIAHLIVTFILCTYMKAAGFIVANAINMLLRIGYSWRHIRNFLGNRTPPISTILPTFSTFVFPVLLFDGYTIYSFGIWLDSGIVAYDCPCGNRRRTVSPCSGSYCQHRPCLSECQPHETPEVCFAKRPLYSVMKSFSLS
ncbi:Rft protein [Cooperia oncophora]